MHSIPNPGADATDKLAQNKLNERDIKDSLKEKREEEKELKHEVSGKLPKSNLIQPGSDLSQRPSQQPAGPGAGQDCFSE